MANTLLIRNKVVHRYAQSFGIVTKKSNRCITACAKQTAHFASIMVMVYCQAFLNACRGFGDTNVFANSTYAVLCSKHLVISFLANTKPFSSMAISCNPIGFLSVTCSPLCLPLSATGATKSLQAVNLRFASRKISNWLHGLTGSTPLHSLWCLWPSNRQSIVTSQICQWLTFNPTKIFSISAGNFSWSATTTLT